jgi:hypothetical protein
MLLKGYGVKGDKNFYRFRKSSNPVLVGERTSFSYAGLYFEKKGLPGKSSDRQSGVTVWVTLCLQTFREAQGNRKPRNQYRGNIDGCNPGQSGLRKGVRESTTKKVDMGVSCR